MINEYALDPALLDNWKDFRFFQQSFGPDKGRLIADFPRKWKRAVLDVLRNSTCGEVEKKRIKESLRHLSTPTLYSRTARHWSGLPTWLENVVKEDAERTFHAIVYRDNDNGLVLPDDHYIQEEELVDTHQYWESENTIIVEREAAKMVLPAASLLSLAQHILFIDPHFNPGEQRFRDPLLSLVNCAANRPLDIAIQRIEYHVSERIVMEHFIHLVDSRLMPLLPTGITLSFVRWPNADMHDRHILTNIGALTYSVGLDEWKGGASPKQMRIQREGITSWKQLWEQYSRGIPFYTVTGT